MNEITEKLIRELSLKIGSMTQNAWDIYLKQIKIDAMTHVLTLVFFTALLIYLIKFVHRKTTVIIKDKNGFGSYPEWEDDAAIFSIIGLIILCIFYVFFALFVIQYIFTAIFNPGYLILKEFIK